MWSVEFEGAEAELGALARGGALPLEQRPQLYFSPKVPGLKRSALKRGIKLAFGSEGHAVERDRDGREIWVLQRPPALVRCPAEPGAAPAAGVTVVATWAFRHPGLAALAPALAWSSRFRVRFRTAAPPSTEVHHAKLALDARRLLARLRGQDEGDGG